MLSSRRRVIYRLEGKRVQISVLFYQCLFRSLFDLCSFRILFPFLPWFFIKFLLRYDLPVQEVLISFPVFQRSCRYRNRFCILPVAVILFDEIPIFADFLKNRKDFLVRFGFYHQIILTRIVNKPFLLSGHLIGELPCFPIVFIGKRSDVDLVENRLIFCRKGCPPLNHFNILPDDLRPEIFFPFPVLKHRTEDLYNRFIVKEAVLPIGVGPFEIFRLFRRKENIVMALSPISLTVFHIMPVGDTLIVMLVGVHLVFNRQRICFTDHIQIDFSTECFLLFLLADVFPILMILAIQIGPFLEFGISFIASVLGSLIQCFFIRSFPEYLPHVFFAPDQIYRVAVLVDLRKGLLCIDIYCLFLRKLLRNPAFSEKSRAKCLVFQQPDQKTGMAYFIMLQPQNLKNVELCLVRFFEFTDGIFVVLQKFFYCHCPDSSLTILLYHIKVHLYHLCAVLR